MYLALHTMLLEQSFMSVSVKEAKHGYSRQVCKLKESMFTEKGQEQVQMHYGEGSKRKTNQGLRAEHLTSHRRWGDMDKCPVRNS